MQWLGVYKYSSSGLASSVPLQHPRIYRTLVYLQTGSVIILFCKEHIPQRKESSTGQSNISTPPKCGVNQNILNNVRMFKEKAFMFSVILYFQQPKRDNRSISNTSFNLIMCYFFKL